MSDTQNTSTTGASPQEHTTEHGREHGPGSTEAVVSWLESEFPGWQIDVDQASGWQGELRPVWIARRSGHHPQAELTPAKLHSRLSDYLDREARRRAMAN